MNPVYKFFAIPSIVVSGLIVVLTALFVLALSFSAYPTSVLVLIPWYLGVCGLIGLLAAFGDPEVLAPVQLGIRIALLICGIVGAVIFCTLYIRFILASGGSVSQGVGAPVLAFAMVFPVLPVCAALIALRSLTAAWTGNARAAMTALVRTSALVFSPLILLLSARILVQEAGMLWYGHDLASKAQASAALIANGSPYCVIDTFGTDSLDKLPVRRILVQAFNKKFGLDNRPFKEPHFMIAVNDTGYWWSFRQEQFVQMPAYSSILLPLYACPNAPGTEFVR
jgi:hypothetical protein